MKSLSQLSLLFCCRGGLNPPDNTPKGVFVDVFGRKHSAPTVNGNLSLTAMRETLLLL
ncbi:hypothetical protein [Phocaeicola sp.]